MHPVLQFVPVLFAIFSHDDFSARYLHPSPVSTFTAVTQCASFSGSDSICVHVGGLSASPLSAQSQQKQNNYNNNKLIYTLGEDMSFPPWPG